MRKVSADIYDLIQELSWYFGNQGFDGSCCGDLSLVEFMALKNVNDSDDCKVLELGEALNITKSGASKIIDRLEIKGYVVRKQSSEDGRVCCVGITKQGTEAVIQIVAHYARYISEVLKDTEPTEIEAITVSLAKLVVSLRKKGYSNRVALKGNGDRL